jgi:hypothetical protein
MRLLFFSIILIIALNTPLFVFACPPDCGSENSTGGGQNVPVRLDNPLTGNNTSLSVNQLIGRIINAVLGVVGSLALLMFVYGGLVWMTASGASDKVQKGKDILIWATIGLIVIFMSYALVNFVLGTVIGGGAATTTTRP